MRKLPTLRQFLLLLAVACVLPMAVLALALAAYGYDRERREIEQDTIGTARALMAAVDDRLEGTQRALLTLAESPALAADDFARLHQEALVVQRTEQASNILVVDAAGRQAMNTRRPWGSELPQESPPQMLEPFRRGAPAVLDLFRSPITGAPMAGVGVPVPEGPAGPLALNAHIESAALLELLARQKLPAGWSAALVDRAGVIVARTGDPRAAGTRAPPELVARATADAEAAVDGRTPEGIAVLTTFSRSARSGWTVAISMPQAALRASLLRTVAVLLAGTAAVLALTVLLAWRLASALGRSVEALGSAVRASGHRTSLHLPDATFQEARQLGLAFLHAHTALEDARAALLRSEARMRAILDTASDAIVTADDGGRIVLFNDAAERLFRLPRAKALGQPVEWLVPDSQREQHMNLRRQSAEGVVRSMAGGRRIEGRRSDGSIFHAYASISVAHEPDGRLYTVMLREAAREDALPV